MFCQTNRTQAEMVEKCCFLFLVTLIFDLWFDLKTRPCSEDQTRLRVNLAQICSAVPEIFHTETKKAQTDSAKNRTIRSSLRAVIIAQYFREYAADLLKYNFASEWYSSIYLHLIALIVNHIIYSGQ